MDRRTLIFVVSLSLSLFVINTFFDYQNQETRKEWIEQQGAKKRQKVKQLESLITQKTENIQSLPITALYLDEKQQDFLSNAILVEGQLLTVAWSDQLPETIYAKVSGQTRSYNLLSSDTRLNTPVIYGQKEQKPLKIGSLPDFGKYELQAVNLSQVPAKATIAEYTDGHFSLPIEEINALKKELSTEDDSKTQELSGNLVILTSSEGQYLPVAIYNLKSKNITYLKNSSNIDTEIIKKKQTVNNLKNRKAEQFFVLENQYQQLVFSSYGGALAEINLPFQSDENHLSVVKEIEFDRDMVEKHPYNARFPAHEYFTSEKAAPGKLKEHDQGKLGGYYPLIRRDLIESGKRKSVKISPQNYALNIISDYPETAEAVYEVKHFDDQTIVFESKQDRRKITKTYTLGSEETPYVINLSVKVEGDGRGLFLTSGVPEVELISGSFTPSLKFRQTRSGKSEVKLIDLPTDMTTVTSTDPDWLCNSNGFFGLIIDPLNHIDPGYRAEYVSGAQAPTRLVEIDQENERFQAKNYPGYQTMLPLWDKGGSMEFRIFAGPFSTPILKQVDAAYSKDDYNPDYIACQTFHGWFAFISEPFAKFLFLLMTAFHSFTGSWGISIILLTVALRVMLYPLNAWSTKSMLRTQQIMPQIQAIQEKYKSDPKRAQMEVLNFYKEKGINPLSGMTGGCFPLLIQMPFLIGMFDLLKSSFQLRGASFIPGWIDNLSAPDVLFSWKTHIPFIGTEFHLLPVILGVIMFFQPRMMSTLPKDKNEWSEQQKQQRMMGNVMAVMFTWLFYSFPSGLNIYWTSSMLLGMAQQWWNKQNLTNSSNTEMITPEKQSSHSKIKTKKKNRL